MKMLMSLPVLAQADSGGAEILILIFALVFGAIGFLFILLLIVSMWKVFTKAGQPGWAALVPIYNTVVLVQIAGKELWWVILFFLPMVNLIAAIIVSMALAERFGKGQGFGIGLALLPVVFFPLLAFSDARYQGQVQPAFG